MSPGRAHGITTTANTSWFPFLRELQHGYDYQVSTTEGGYQANMGEIKSDQLPSDKPSRSPRHSPSYPLTAMYLRMHCSLASELDTGGIFPYSDVPKCAPLHTPAVHPLLRAPVAWVSIRQHGAHGEVRGGRLGGRGRSAWSCPGDRQLPQPLP